MVEFRTRAIGENETNSSSLETHLEQVYENIRTDPELKKRLMSEASKNDIDPVLLRALFGNDMPSQDELEQNMAPNEPQLQDETGATQTEAVTETKRPDANQFIGFLEEIRDLAPDNMTLDELQEWAKTNEDIVETAIKMRF